jgi:hypothetical protein
VLLVVTLLAPAVDLLNVVQPGWLPPIVGILAIASASAALLVTWIRFPRTSWLAAATLAASASLALRLAGAEVAPFLSLLMVVALGIGGAFASPTRESQAWLG